MSREETVETLPGIIKSLAQQVSTRDAQIKSERAKFAEELSAMKDQHEAMRTERDSALRSAEAVSLQGSRLEDEVKSLRREWSIDVERVQAQGEDKLAKDKAGFDLERAEWKRKVELLEQAADHQVGILSQTQSEAARARSEAEDWKSRYTTVASKASHHSEEWSSQFSRVANRLDELATVRLRSDSGSSPTVIPFGTSSPPKITATDRVSPSKPPRQPRIVPHKMVNPKSAAATSGSTINTPQNRTLRSQDVLATPVRPSGKDNHSLPSRPPSPPPRANASSPQLSFQIQARAPSQDNGQSRSQPSPVKLASQSALPPDRVIITAHYEVKREDEADSDDPSLLDPLEASGLGSSREREGEESEGGFEEPVAKRRRTTTRKQSTRRIVDEEDDDKEEIDQIFYEADGDAEMREVDRQSNDDFDEMAIGAEDNHKEVYGHRKVNVREVNTRPRTPLHRTHARNVSNSGGSSSRKRKPAPAPTTTNGRPTPAKTKR